MKLGPTPRVLIVRLGAIGDVVNALVVANAIRKHRPDAYIGWASHPLSAPLVETHPAIDRVHVLPRGGGLRALREHVREVRAESYGCALDLQRLQKSAWLARRSGAKRVIGFDRGRCKELSWIWTRERIEAGPRREHMVLQYQRFLKVLGLPDEVPIRDLGEDAEAESWADAWLHSRRLSAPPLLINLGASKPEKRWPKESFLELMQTLFHGDDECAMVLTGGPGDREYAEWLMAHFEEQGAGRRCTVHSAVAETTLPQLVALIRRSKAMVTGDTGAMHMAAALGVPTVAMFGPSDPVRTGPFGENHVVLQGTRRFSGDSGLSAEEPRVIIPMAGLSPKSVAAATKLLIEQR